MELSSLLRPRLMERILTSKYIVFEASVDSGESAQAKYIGNEVRRQESLLPAFVDPFIIP